MSDQSELLTAIAAMMDDKIAAAIKPVEVAKATTTKATGTVAKASAIKRNLDPIDVVATDRVTFRVLASNGGGPISRGARWHPVIDGKVYRSSDEEATVALAEDGVLDELVAAIATVNKRALLGPHAPAKVAAQASS